MTASLPAFLLRRVLAALLFVALVSTATFSLARFAPGDATTDLMLSGAGPGDLAAERERLGLDRPFAEQIGRWAAGLVRLDLGWSSRFGRPVSGLILERALRTAQLAALALLLAVAVGLPLGVLTGLRPRGPVGVVIAPVSLALIACPPLVGALALLWLAAGTGWLSSPWGQIGVPVLALALPLAATLERLQSQATAETLGSPDLIAAAARGVPYSRLVWVHAVRQSLRPVLGVFGLLMGGLFSGSLAVEWITSWPGLGRLTYDALVGRDLFLIAGCALAGAALIAAGNVLADIARALADPRVREEA